MPIEVHPGAGGPEEGRRARERGVGRARPRRRRADRARGRRGRSTGGSTSTSRWSSGRPARGTQTNMNVNEVISNRAIEIAGGELGSKTPVHPNDHVNMSQSSNDTFPTAMHIAAAERDRPPAPARRSGPARRARDKAEAFAGHRQDRPHAPAGRHAADARAGVRRLCRAARRRHRAHQATLPGLYELALGGTAVGTGLNTHPEFAEAVAAKIAELTGLPFVSAAEQVRGAGRARRPRVRAAVRSRPLAVSLMKIANDIRLARLGPALRARRARRCPRTSRAPRSCRAR